MWGVDEHDRMMAFFERRVTAEVCPVVGIAGFGPAVREIAAGLPFPPPTSLVKETPHP